MKISHKLSIIILATLGSTAYADTSIVKNPANGHLYQRIDTPAMWSDAQSTCAASNGYLVSITTQAELQWIASNLYDPQYPKVWIGGQLNQKNGAWQWVSGEKWNYTNWGSGWPDNWNGIETSIEMLMDSGSVWNDLPPNTEARPYICEWNTSMFNGKVYGVGSHTVSCTNTTTTQNITFSTKEKEFDCVGAGLVVSPKDKVTITISGSVK